LLRDTLNAQVLRLGPGPFAIRSSAVGEDSASQSFAGQLETHLNVQADDVYQAVLHCVDSASKLRVLRYAGSAGEVAVIVQRMVPADQAGVAFSADVQTGQRGVTHIEAVDGLGDLLVSGLVTPEAWTVEAHHAKRVRAEQPVLTPDQALSVAALATRMEQLFGAPQDIEWAFREGVLYLLQSRPITALPAAPIPLPVIAPAGTWERDDHHAVLSPLGWTWFQAYPQAMCAQMKKLGVPLERINVELIGGHLYMQMVMAGGGGEKVPPNWVMWLITRLLPSMRRANRECAELLEEESFMRIVERWETSLKGQLQATLNSLYVEDPSTLDDDALLLRISEAMAFAARGLTEHAELHAPGTLGLGKLVLFLKDELGWSPDRALEMVTGCSGQTTELHRSIEAIVAEHLSELVGRDFPHSWAALSRSAPRLGAALADFLRQNSLRILHYDPKHLTLGEQPELLLSIAEAVCWGLRNPQPADPTELAWQAEARAVLPPNRFSELKRLVGIARRGYALRDENGIETVSRPAGLLRHFVIELGRRIEPQLGRREYAVYLTPDEHRAALSGQLPNLRELIAERRGHESWANMNRGPLRYGPEPAPFPPLDAFPSGLRRMMRIFEWMMTVEVLKDVEVSEDGTLVGTGIGTRTVTARARVVDRPEQLSALRHGEVLVCRITSPEWSIALGRVAAVVTSEGGALSHPAIIAREYGISAVVGARNATQHIRTGDRVKVDPIDGTVRVVSEAPC
jgi:pyruvate,water dikinase